MRSARRAQAAEVSFFSFSHFFAVLVVTATLLVERLSDVVGGEIIRRCWRRDYQLLVVGSAPLLVGPPLADGALAALSVTRLCWQRGSSKKNKGQPGQKNALELTITPYKSRRPRY